MEHTTYSTIEEKWQKKWTEDKVFETSANTQKEKFFATVPYPYANSVLHIGHGRAYTTADIYTRYQRVLGKNVLFPMAYHISGTPVLAVADAIKRGDEKQIALTRDAIADYIEDKEKQEELLKKFHDPYEIADFFSNTIKGALQSVGISIDWTREFTTGDNIYNKFIEWQYKKLYELGILVQGRYPILYSPEDHNAVGEDDIKDGDVDKVTIQEMTYILFERRDSDQGDETGETNNEFFVAATLRPDALFGATNMWIHPEHELVKIRVGEQRWIIGKGALTKIQHQFDDVEVISEHKGSEFINETVLTPIIQREIPIAKADFVDSNHGTGIVYSSPAGSPHDFTALKEAKEENRLDQRVQVINTVDTFDKQGNKIEYLKSCPAEDKCEKYGVNNSNDEEQLEKAKQELYKEEHFGGVLNSQCGELAGIPIAKAKEKVYETLQKQGVGGTFYETSRRAKTRGGAEVIVATLDNQWFLDYTNDDVKSRAHQVLDGITYYPEKLKATQKGYIDWVQMRPCARRRGIGTKLPQDPDWVIEPLSDSTLYPMLYLIKHIIARENLKQEQLTQELFDYVYLNQGNPTIISEDTQISQEILQEMRAEVDYWRGFDLRYTASAHMSNHLTFLIYHYSLIFPQQYWPNNITVGGMLIKDGEKISKSKGNGIPLQRIGKKYGSDLYRLYVALAANYDTELDFRDEEITQLEKKFEKWISIIRLSNNNNLEYTNFTHLQKWIISRFYSRVQEYFTHFSDLRIREAYVAIVYEFLNDFGYFQTRATKQEIEEVCSFIARDYLIVMTPAIPHMCEELNNELGNTNYISVEQFDTQYQNYINTEVEEIESIAQEIITGVNRQKDQKKLSTFSTIKLTQAPQRRFELFDRLKELLESNTSPKAILSTLGEEFSEDKKFIQKFVPKTFGSGLSQYLTSYDEKIFLEEFSQYLEKEFSCSVIIEQAEDNSKGGVPGRPSITIE